MDSVEEIFFTKSKYRDVQSSEDDTDTDFNDIPDLEGERRMQNFEVKLDILVIFQMMICWRNLIGFVCPVGQHS